VVAVRLDPVDALVGEDARCGAEEANRVEEVAGDHWYEDVQLEVAVAAADASVPEPIAMVAALVPPTPRSKLEDVLRDWSVRGRWASASFDGLKASSGGHKASFGGSKPLLRDTRARVGAMPLFVV
jgi:hypothetical protein